MERSIRFFELIWNQIQYVFTRGSAKGNKGLIQKELRFPTSNPGCLSTILRGWNLKFLKLWKIPKTEAKNNYHLKNLACFPRVLAGILLLLAHWRVSPLATDPTGSSPHTSWTPRCTRIKIWRGYGWKRVLPLQWSSLRPSFCHAIWP